jgi:hypothetical protein
MTGLVVFVQKKEGEKNALLRIFFTLFFLIDQLF